jgi:hypothetical protein
MGVLHAALMPATSASQEILPATPLVIIECAVTDPATGHMGPVLWNGITVNWESGFPTWR